MAVTQEKQPLSRARAGCFAGLALCLGLVVGLLLAEAAVRFRFRDVPPNLLSTRQFYRPAADELRVYEPVPGFQTPSGDVINSVGLRGPETTVEKPEGVYRIAVLGDSYTFGQGVHEPETWVRRLEHLLRQRWDTEDVEVLNFGVPGYNTKNELGALGRALDFDPDLVLVAHLVNDDLWDILRVSYDTLVFQTEADLDEAVPLPGRVKRGLYRNSLLYRLVATHLLRRRHLRFRDDTGRGEVVDAARAGWQNDGDGIDGPRLEQIFDTCRDAGVDVALIQVPLTRAKVQTERAPEERTITDSLQALADRHGVPLLDLFPVLQGIDGTPLQVAPGDTHPNADLHARYAERIADWLVATLHPL